CVCVCVCVVLGTHRFWSCRISISGSYLCPSEDIRKMFAFCAQHNITVLYSPLLLVSSPLLDTTNSPLCCVDLLLVINVLEDHFGRSVVCCVSIVFSCSLSDQ